MLSARFKNRIWISPLNKAAKGPQGQASRASSMTAPLLLTSLVDIFAVLIIYLLVNTSATKEMKLAKGVHLPLAHHSNSLKMGVPLRVQDGEYFVRNRKVNVNYLKNYLAEEIRQNPEQQRELLVQADKNLGFSFVNPIMIAASEAGYERIKFAVVHKEQK